MKKLAACFVFTLPLTAASASAAQDYSWLSVMDGIFFISALASLAIGIVWIYTRKSKRGSRKLRNQPTCK